MLTPSTRPFRSALVALGTIVVLSAAFACGSSNELVPFGSGTTEDAAPGSFIPRDDAGDAAVDVRVDGSSSAQLCVATECPAPFATCPTYAGTLPTYACETDTSTDVENCGICGRKCPQGSTAYHFRRACVGGQCQPFCEAGYADCNGVPDDGCESDPKTDRNNCGVCGVACAAGVACIEGKCGCPPGQTNCDGACVDLQNDDGSCGSCGTRCKDHQPDGGVAPPHMFFGCQQGACKQLKCVQDSEEFWADCNGTTAVDGCEVDLEKPSATNCGSCGNACAAGKQCFSTSDTGMACQCQTGKSLCPESQYAGPSCADLENDPQNCGSCGYVCPFVDNADLVCSHGHCGYSCQPGRADCNGRAEDGCEVVLAKDPRHCGACGNACDVGQGQPCVGGQCATQECDAGVIK